MSEPNPQPDDEPPLPPPYKNYLVFCDESGVNGTAFYGFGSFWIPYERRGDLHKWVSDLRQRHRYLDEIKWSNVSKSNLPFYVALTKDFFAKNYMMFHCILVRKAYVDTSFHGDDPYDLARRKHFAMLLNAKISVFSKGSTDKRYHVRVDKLPSRYAKADEAARSVLGSTLTNAHGVNLLASLQTRDSKLTLGIQIADYFIGAVATEWNQVAAGEAKLEARRTIAASLGWKDLNADTFPTEQKFNIWAFHDPKAGSSRERKTRLVQRTQQQR